VKIGRRSFVHKGSKTKRIQKYPGGGSVLKPGCGRCGADLHLMDAATLKSRVANLAMAQGQRLIQARGHPQILRQMHARGSKTVKEKLRAEAYHCFKEAIGIFKAVHFEEFRGVPDAAGLQEDHLVLVEPDSTRAARAVMATLGLRARVR
jgi:hypothetical protein